MCCEAVQAQPHFFVTTARRRSVALSDCDAGSNDHAQAVENLLLTREAIRGVASKHGKVATCLPKLTEADSGNGAHLHWSLQTVRSASTARLVLKYPR